jgi:hypothetical protein
MKYGDVVTYVRNGVALNALVLHSQQAVDGERLIVAYADPQFSGSGITRAIATAFDVKPFVEGANQGWKEIVAPINSELRWLLGEQDQKIAALQAELAAKTSAADQLATPEEATGVPSAADLDAAAEDQKAAEATGAEETPEAQ